MLYNTFIDYEQHGDVPYFELVETAKRLHRQLPTAHVDVRFVEIAEQGGDVLLDAAQGHVKDKTRDIA